MGEKIADIGDVREQACYQRIVARLADGDALEGSVLDRAELVVKSWIAWRSCAVVVLSSSARRSTPLTKAMKRSNRSSRRIKTRLRSHPQINSSVPPAGSMICKAFESTPMSSPVISGFIAATVIERTGMPGQLGMLAHDPGVE